MTPDQRLRLALAHKEPDRIPFDLGSTRVTGIAQAAYSRLRDSLRLPSREAAVADLVQGLAAPDEDLLRTLEVDTRGLFPRAPTGWGRRFSEANGYRSFIDEWGVTWISPLDGGLYYDVTAHPLAGAITLADVKAYPWPDGRDVARVAGLAEEGRGLAEEGHALVLVGVTAGVVEQAARVRGPADFFCDLAADPDLACAIMDAVLEVKLGYWEGALAEVGDLAQVVAEADDLADQRGLMFSRDTYRRLMKPRHQRLFQSLRSWGNVRVFMHSCGAVRELIPDLIEAGVDILNPVQVSAQGMDTARLKRDFGDALTFWGGGVDTQHVLPRDTPQQVRDEVRRRIDDLAPGGGFVFAAVHNIQADVPPQNVEAMWEAMCEYGSYGE
jgi:uroporphyrinogen decarboxylase